MACTEPVKVIGTVSYGSPIRVVKKLLDQFFDICVFNKKINKIRYHNGNTFRQNKNNHRKERNVIDIIPEQLSA